MLCSLMIFSTFSFGQSKHLSIGDKNNGICFGNAEYYNGLKLTVWENNSLNFNGLNISLVSTVKHFNGLSFAVLLSDDSIFNGINIGCLGAGAYEMNGFALGGITVLSKKINGLGISGFVLAADTMNGFFISLVGSTQPKGKLINQVNGVSMGLLCGVNCQSLNGLSVGFCNLTATQHGVVVGVINKTSELHGFQFGIWNIAENNRFFKHSPVLNFNLRKRLQTDQ